MKEAHEIATVKMVEFLTAVLDLEKPLVCIVSGGNLGIACTSSSLADFIYCTPDAYFYTPFISTF